MTRDEIKDVLLEIIEAMELRKRYRLQIPEEDYPELATLDSCVNYLEPRLKDV